MAVLPDSSTGADQCEQQEKQAGYFKPENMHDAANVAGGHLAGVIESSHQAIFARSVARYPQECAALSAETTRCQKTSSL